MQNARRIRFLANNFGYLQGLKSIPIGLAVMAIGWLKNTSVFQEGDLGVPLLVLVAGWVGYEVADRIYRAMFGQVRRSLAQRLPEIGLGVLTLIAAYAALWVDPKYEEVGSALGVTVAVLLGIDYVRTSKDVGSRYTWYVAVFAAGLLIFSLLPALGLKQWWRAVGFQSQELAILTLLGIIIVAMGILSHLTLIKLFREAGSAYEPGV